ncbi:MAG: hypothetical protein GC162_02315 [Planctomycetes bacterium]|nr:hypothetical protein [Planctomycetota bacterium]
MAKKTSAKTAKSTKKATTKKKVTKKVTKKTAKKSTKKAPAPKSTPKIKAAKFNGVSSPAKKTTIVERDPDVPLKSPMSKKELQYYRDLLLMRRAEILGDMTTMSTEALRADASNLSNMPLHMADVGSDNYEKELTLGLVESERQMIQEINDALSRIADGTFGVCVATGKRINKARLTAKPWAKYCIEAAREMERGRRFG